MKPETTAFLKRFYELLKKDYWGAIDPYLFDPDFLDPEEDHELRKEQAQAKGLQEPDDEQGWAKQLQELVEQALEETAPGRTY